MTLKFTILGCGSSGGVPRPALGWGDCDPNNPRNRRRRTSLLVERRDTSRKKVLARHLAQRQALYARAVNAADYRTALAILADDAKLRGLYPENELKELTKLAAEQGKRIEDLERRLRDAHLGATTSSGTDASSPPAGSTGGGAAGPS